jgi:transposase
MAKERTSVRMQAQIKTLSEQGHSIRRIARILRLSRRTVRKFLEPASQPAAESGGWIETVDWEYVRQEVYGKGTTVKQIQREVAPDIAYVKFWRAFREKVSVQASPDQVTIRLDHKPAEKTQIDFCDGLFLTDPVTGNKTLTQFFLGVLPFSSYFFGEFVLDQKLATFIGVQSRMFAYFGGVTPYVVVDNLKSRVNKADLYDPDVNPTYCDFANHMGDGSLRAMFRDARRSVQRNPFSDLPINWWPRQPQRQPDPYTEEERERILAHYRRNRPYWAYAFVYFRFHTGTRPSEATALRWGRVDFQTGATISLSRHLGEERAPKTRASGRTITLLPNVINVLKIIQPLVLHPDSYVFIDGRGRPIDQSEFARGFQGVLRTLKIRRGPFTTHGTHLSAWR